MLEYERTGLQYGGGRVWSGTVLALSVGQASFRGLILFSVWGSDAPRKALEGLGLRGSVGLLKALPRTLLVRV